MYEKKILSFSNIIAIEKIKLFGLLLVILVIFSGCATTFDGYYYDLEKARYSENDIYSQYDHLFTAEYAGGMIDFVVQDDSLHIVHILSRNDNTQFFVKARMTYRVSECLNDSKSKNQYHWLRSTALEPQQYQCCIVEKSYNEQNLNIEAFEFAYQDTVVHLCYEIIEK